MTRMPPSETGKRLAPPAGYEGIHDGIVELLDAARQAAARNVNALMTASYWDVGRRIVEAEQKGRQRAGYGDQLIERLSTDLSVRFGRGFGVNNLENMRRFFLTYPQPSISQNRWFFLSVCLNPRPTAYSLRNHEDATSRLLRGPSACRRKRRLLVDGHQGKAWRTSGVLRDPPRTLGAN